VLASATMTKPENMGHKIYMANREMNKLEDGGQ